MALAQNQEIENGGTWSRYSWKISAFSQARLRTKPESFSLCISTANFIGDSGNDTESMQFNGYSVLSRVSYDKTNALSDSNNLKREERLYGFVSIYVNRGEIHFDKDANPALGLVPINWSFVIVEIWSTHHLQLTKKMLQKNFHD